ncbi:Acetylcholinesterase [Strongyloides ratti]|uniref:Acetylcholinesterase n=1 Tax=Strongyloides ratti TaxID=34506 RepID=A0A090LES3_STRRB|nr:Acetylcholinesterase [Strongyloides ratti]CEF66035.1 Acetylcholinesterase [Strongyloides ratti]
MTIYFIYLLSLFFTLIFGEKIYTTNYGKVIGKKLVFSNGKVTEFLGIPFAKPPKKELRFMPPVQMKIPAWKNILHATTPAISCPQLITKMNFSGSDEFNPTNRIGENCLQLNMWVPKNKSGATIVFLHGGAFRRGSGSVDIYNGSVLALESEAIIVNLNYRINIFGFGYLSDNSSIKGNMGFLDQQMGLKWVYENIEYFGGKKDMITLYGQSVGGVSATAHLLNKESVKYFNRMIISSGVIFNIFGAVLPKYIKRNTINVAKKLGCPIKKKNLENIISCLKEKKPSTLLKASKHIRVPKQMMLNSVFSPIQNDSVFFKRDIRELFDKKTFYKHVDLLIGRTSDESSVFMPEFLSKYGCVFDPLISPESPDNQCNLSQQVFEGLFSKLHKSFELTESEKEQFIAIYNTTKYKNYRDKIKRFTSDLMFDCQMIKFANTYYETAKKNVYFYEFRKRSPINPWPKWMGAMQGRELKYVFGHPFRYPSKYPKKNIDDEQMFSRKLMQYFGRFAKYGDFGKRWQKFTKNNRKALVIDGRFSKSNKTFYIKAYTDTCVKFDNIINKIINRYIEKIHTLKKFKRK